MVHGRDEQKKLARVGLKVGEIHKFNDRAVGRLKNHLGSKACLQRFRPPCDAEAPLVAGFEPGKIVFRHRRREVISTLTGKRKELISHHSTHGVKSMIARTRATEAVTIKSGDRFHAATFQRSSEDIGFHGGSMTLPNPFAQPGVIFLAAGLDPGLIASIVLIVVSPDFMENAIFPLKNPAIASIPIGFLGAFLGTLLGPRDNNAEAMFAELQVRGNTGLGAEKASAH